mgnify:CR=1 FL=1
MNQKSIIIVDDDASLLRMLKERFLLEGYHCETATSAESALELIKKTPFDILLTDIAFPGMKGFELTRKVKKLRPETMVILMTGFIDAFSYDSAIEAGALDFIKKPFTYKELEVRIEHVKMQEKHDCAEKRPKEIQMDCHPLSAEGKEGCSRNHERQS